MGNSRIKYFRLLISIAFLLAGCTQQYSALTAYNHQLLEKNEHSDHIPPELQPVPSEPEMCIVEELAELRETGSWVDTTEANISQEDETSTYNFPVVTNKQVTMYLNLFQNKQRRHLQQWMARSGKYKQLMERELVAAGLPTDLVYLAMIESGFNQRASSHARAVGLWQFMKGTGRDYNLKVDRYVDERRDAEKSTKAAVAYLSDLYDQFGDWHLAVAAYNAGPGKIRSGLRRHKVKTFWELAEKRHLKLETKRYVPKLIAAIIIAKEPEKYGFQDLRLHPPLTYDYLEVGPGLSLDAIALVSKGSVKDIQFLNQELKTGKTPLNRPKYIVKIPAGSKERASHNMTRLHSVVHTGYKTHIFRHNEKLSSICRKYNINTTTLLKVNNLRSGKLVSGQRLRIPYNTVKYQLLPENSKAISYAKNSLILHKIVPGETISKIATRYSVPPEMIVNWNGLASVHKIRAGQQLALYINRGTASDTHTVIASKQKRKFFPAQENTVLTPMDNIIVLTGTKKRTPTSFSHASYQWYQVKSGDTLWTISRRFNTSPKKIRQWNNLKSNRIHPGNRLKLKTV